jgi:hypothetical protein
VSLYEEMSSVLSKLDFNMGETLEYGLLGQEAPTFPFKKLLVKKKVLLLNLLVFNHF